MPSYGFGDIVLVPFLRERFLDVSWLSAALFLTPKANSPRHGCVGAWTVLGMVFAQKGDQRSALGALLNAGRFSKDQAKTIGYFTQLAETDPRTSVREAAAEAMRQAGL
jgi:hypothetical protein